MNFKKQHIVLIIVTALVFSVLGTYTGIKLANKGTLMNNNGINLTESRNDQGKDMTKISEALALIQEHYIEDVDQKQLVEGAIEGMLQTLDDPYSTYMDIETMESFNEQIESSFEGIGAEVSMVDGKVTIVSPIKDSPAEEAGLRANDQIISIDKNTLEGLDLNEAVEKIRGEKGSEVVLEIQRPGVTKPFEVAITRDEIPIETVYADMKTIDGKKTGIIEITSFSETTAEDFNHELSSLEKEGIEGLVIDVRGNPGGLLDSVEEILGLFIPKDMPFLQIEDKKGNKTPHYSNSTNKKEYPISILIDEGSASASEILSVALKETGYDVVGMTSFGKGTVQQAVPLGDGSTIKLTFYKWLSPKGNWINEKGVEPTIEVKQPEYYYTHPVQIDKTLLFNETGEEIKNLQIMLDGLGYDIKRKDGYFDQTTVEAVKAFQQDHQLEVNGKIDKKTSQMIETNIVEKIRNRDDDKQLEEALKQLY